jgi:hypothetical protein
LRLALAVLPLAVAMIEPSFSTPLIPPIGTAPLPEPGFAAASQAAVALSAVTVGTEIEHRVAAAAEANPLPENHCAMNRHACSAGGAGQRHALRGNLEPASFGGLTKVAIREPRRFQRRGSFPASRLPGHITPLLNWLMIGRMIRA